ncbi:RNA chaperone Hfq, partial [Peribacillus frigoritolerans]
MKQSVNIQDQFLNQLRKDGTYVTVFLLNGFQIRGQVKGFDNFTV